MARNTSNTPADNDTPADVLGALKTHTRALTGKDNINPHNGGLHRHGNDLYYYDHGNGSNPRQMDHPDIYNTVNIAGAVYATDSRISNDALIGNCDCCDCHGVWAADYIQVGSVDAARFIAKTVGLRYKLDDDGAAYFVTADAGKSALCRQLADNYASLND